MLIHIEVKVDAPEGEDQTIREWRDVAQRAKCDGIPLVKAVVLTRDRSKPQDDHFDPISWKEVAGLLKDRMDCVGSSFHRSF